MLSIEAAAAAKGVSASTIKRMIANGKLPAEKFGKSIRIPASALGPAKQTEAEQFAQIMLMLRELIEMLRELPQQLAHQVADLLSPAVVMATAA